MRWKTYSFPAVLLFIIVVMMTGAVITLAAVNEPIRDAAVACLTHGGTNLLLFGGGFIAAGIALIAVIVKYNRRMYLRIQMGRDRASIDTRAIEAYLSSYWKAAMPSQKVKSRVITVRDNAIEIVVRFKAMPSDNLEAFLEKTEHDLAKILSRKFMYSKPFTFSFSFPSS